MAKRYTKDTPFCSKGLPRKTSAEIIREAKQELSKKYLQQELSSFGMTITPIGSRPASSSSQLSFVAEPERRPTSGVRLKPLYKPVRHIKSNHLPFELVDDDDTSTDSSVTKRNILPPISSLIRKPFPVIEDDAEASRVGSSNFNLPLISPKDVASNQSSIPHLAGESPTKVSQNTLKSKKSPPSNRKISLQSTIDTLIDFSSDSSDTQFTKSSKTALKVNSIESLNDDEMSSSSSTSTTDNRLLPVNPFTSSSFTEASNISNLTNLEPLISELSLKPKSIQSNLSPSITLPKLTHPTKSCKSISKTNKLEPISTKATLSRHKKTTNINFSPIQLSVRASPEKFHETTSKISIGKNIGSKSCLENHGKSEKKTKNYKDDPKKKEFNLKVLKILSVLENMIKNEKSMDESQAIEAVEKLLILFENYNMFVNNFEARFYLLKVLFKLLNVRYPILSLEIIKLILQMKVGGRNLENICKLLLKLYFADETNVADILNSGAMGPFIESMQDIDVRNCLRTIEHFTILVHAASSVDELIPTLGVLNFQYPLVCHLEGLNSLESSEINKKHINIAVKIISSLRNLSSSDLVWKLILNREILEKLLKTLRIYQDYSEVSLLTIGFLTEIANKPDGCKGLASCENICFTFVELLKSQSLLPSIVIQILLIIGNLVIAGKDLASMFFIASDFKDFLFSILRVCSEKQLERARRVNSFCRNPKYSTMDDVISETDIELMTNAVRILGNMCLDQKTGYSLSDDVDCITSFMQVLRLYKTEHTGFVASVEEPLSCAHAGLKNISYYITDESPTLPLCGEIINLLVSFLFEPYTLKIRVETCTTIQNLMRLGEARLHVLHNKLLSTFVELLNAHENEIIIGGYGIFMNLLIEEEARKIFNLNKGLSALRRKLNMFLYRDWKVSTLLCKVLWNYCFYESTTDQTLPPSEAQRILKTLQTSSNASVLPNTSDNIEKCTWEKEFVPTARNLITLLEINTLSKQ